MIIREIERQDVEQITAIYNYYIEGTTISFEEAPVTPEIILQRIAQVKDAGLVWLVAEDQGAILGYAYAGMWKPRSAYRFTVEPSVYLSPESAGRGVGKQLYNALFDELKRKQIRNAIAVIALPNPSSIGLHESMGFEKVGEFANIGVKFGKQISVGYWQLELA